jgi:hypothetical protein
MEELLLSGAGNLLSKGLVTEKDGSEMKAAFQAMRRRTDVHFTYYAVRLTATG